MSENYCAFRLINRLHESQHKSMRKVTFKSVYRYHCSIISAFAVHKHI